MDKRILLLTLTVCFLLTGCGKKGIPQQMEQSPSVPTISNTTASSEQLKSILAKNTTNNITFFESISIGENQSAAFAMAGGEVWYITSSGAQKLKSGISSPPEGQSETPVLWTVDGVEVFKCEDVPGGSSSVSHAWCVIDGKPVELPYTGMGLSYSGNGQFTTIGESFDAVFLEGMGTGHTYKHYYLYWQTNRLKEYGGLKITQQQLLKVQGAREVINVINKSGHTVDVIYYRANNRININYHSGKKENRDFDNLTLVYKNNTVTPELVYPSPNSSNSESFNEENLRAFSYGGIYQAAFFPEIATYPDEFPVN